MSYDKENEIQETHEVIKQLAKALPMKMNGGVIPKIPITTGEKVFPPSNPKK